MTNVADFKLSARQAVQDTFGLPAIFYAEETSTPTVDDTLTVRLHDKSEKVGDLAGTNLSYAEQYERPTTLTFDVAEIEAGPYVLSRGAMVVMADYSGRPIGFYVEVVNPRDGNTQTCQVAPLSAAQLAGKLLPDGTTV